MDPKNFPTNLDPKLKEAYDRVMGTATNPTPPAANPPPPPPVSTPTMAQPTPPPHPVNSGMGMPPPIQPPAQAAMMPQQPQIPPTPQPTLQPAQPAAPYQVPSLQNAAAAAQAGSLKPMGKVVTTGKASSPVMKILVIIGAIIFFLVYAVVWIKVFHFKTPIPLPF